MNNFITASILFLLLIYIAYKYLTYKKPTSTHCGHVNKTSIFDNFIFHLVECILFLPKLIIAFLKSQKNYELPFDSDNDGKLKVAFIGNYGTSCGISTYNEALLKELRYHCDVKVFAEYYDNEKLIRLEEDPSWVIRCWDRNQHPKTDLIQYVLKWQPDIIHFSHEYGIWYKAYFFTQIISIFKQKGFKIVSTMHSVYDHMDKLASESAVPNLIVHTEQGKVTLIKKGIDENKINVIPHGTKIYKGTSDSPELLEPLWNTWQSEHTIYQPGFLFGYKGHLRMLNVVARLKEKYPDIHYIIQGSENKLNMDEHDQLYNQIIAESEKLGLSENITINRGFVSEEVLLSAIRTVKVCVLPYNNHPEHDVRASSGAARTILPTCTPLVVSGVHLFDDLEGVVPRARDDNELYNALDDIFENYHLNVRKQIDKRAEFLRKTSWESIAYRTYVLYTNVIDEV